MSLTVEERREYEEWKRSLSPEDLEKVLASERRSEARLAEYAEEQRQKQLAFGRAMEEMRQARRQERIDKMNTNRARMGMDPLDYLPSERRNQRVV